MKLFFILPYLLSIINLGCFSTSEKIEDKSKNDTLQRPAYMTENATLLSYADEVDPILVWADYIGPFSKNGKSYSHIQGVQFFYVNVKKVDTIYYENMELRSGAKLFEFKNWRILENSNEAMIQTSNGKDSLLLFSVLQSDEFNRMHKGMEFTNMPTITLENNRYLADVDLEFKLNKVSGDNYELILSDSSRVQYKACSTCKISVQKISFLNRQNGRIYLVDKGNYLDLVNKDDAKIFQGLR